MQNVMVSVSFIAHTWCAFWVLDMLNTLDYQYNSKGLQKWNGLRVQWNELQMNTNAILLGVYIQPLQFIDHCFISQNNSVEKKRISPWRSQFPCLAQHFLNKNKSCWLLVKSKQTSTCLVICFCFTLENDEIVSEKPTGIKLFLHVLVR